MVQAHMAGCSSLDGVMQVPDVQKLKYEMSFEKIGAFVRGKTCYQFGQ